MSAGTCSQQASYRGRLLTLPTVLVQGGVYRVELQLLDGSLSAHCSCYDD